MRSTAATPGTVLNNQIIKLRNHDVVPNQHQAREDCGWRSNGCVRRSSRAAKRFVRCTQKPCERHRATLVLVHTLSSASVNIGMSSDYALLFFQRPFSI